MPSCEGIELRSGVADDTTTGDFDTGIQLNTKKKIKNEIITILSENISDPDGCLAIGLYLLGFFKIDDSSADACMMILLLITVENSGFIPNIQSNPVSIT